MHAVNDAPLESDGLAIEYLAHYDYDVDKALFNLFSELGCGKGSDHFLQFFDEPMYFRIQKRRNFCRS
jgi:hypothetical protein